MMRVTLEIRSGPFAGRRVSLGSGLAVRVGRSALADIVFANDTHMSGVHFVVACDDQRCVLTDLKSSNGTLVNGTRVASVLLSSGDTVVAGETTFFVEAVIENAELPPVPEVKAPVAATPQERLLELLRSDFQPLYALLDAACEPSVLKVLFESKEEYQSLYEGIRGAQLTHFAPYLVRLPEQSSLLNTLVRQGWGKSWGVFLTCGQSLQEVRRHFRHFLMVTLPGGKQVYFRYYDPRVLRIFLPTCTADEAKEFFGPVKYYLVEDEKPDHLLRFSTKSGGLGRKILPLAGGKTDKPRGTAKEG